MRRRTDYRLHGMAAAVAIAGLAAAAMQAVRAGEFQAPERPFLNDLKCLALSPYYVPRNIVGAWLGHEKDLVSFFHESARLPSGRKPSLPEKVAFGTIVIPVVSVGSVPLAVGQAGVVPLVGHTVDLFVAPFGAPLRFPRLDGSGFPRGG